MPAPPSQDAASQERTAVRRLEAGDDPGALKAATLAVQAAPGDAQAWWTLYQVHARMSDYEHALQDVERALLIDPSDRGMRVARAQTEATLRLVRDHETPAMAKAAVVLDPGDASSWGGYALALYKAGDYPDAVAAARRVLRLEPGDPEATSILVLAPASRPADGARTPILAPVLLGLAAIAALCALLALRTRRRRLPRRVSPPERIPALPVEPGSSPALASHGIRLVRVMKQGGASVVYEGADVNLRRRVVVKRLREEAHPSPSRRERFLREARSVAALEHANIVRILAVLEDGPDVDIIYEFIPGRTVQELIREKGRLPFSRAAGVVEAVAAALDHAHGRGIIHRDIRPANIMAAEDDTVKVMDFGAARPSLDIIPPGSMTAIGRPSYSPPEQLAGAACKPSDVYALAVSFYEMVTGQPPLQVPGRDGYVPASRLVPRLPARVDDALAAALELDPERRTRTAGDFSRALNGLTGRAPVT